MYSTFLMLLLVTLSDVHYCWGSDPDLDYLYSAYFPPQSKVVAAPASALSAALVEGLSTVIPASASNATRSPLVEVLAVMSASVNNSTQPSAVAEGLPTATFAPATQPPAVVEGWPADVPNSDTNSPAADGDLSTALPASADIATTHSPAVVKDLVATVLHTSSSSVDKQFAAVVDVSGIHPVVVV